MATTLVDQLVQRRDAALDLLEASAASDDFDPGSADYQQTRSEFERLTQQLEAVQTAQQARASAGELTRTLQQTPQRQTSASLGEQVTRSEAFRAYRTAGGGRAKLLELPVERRAPLTTGDWPITPDRIVAAAPALQTPLLDVLAQEQVSTGTIEVLYYPAAAPVAGVVPEGSLKPEATMAAQIQTHNLDTLAHWLESTRQLIEDDRRVQDFINNGLLRGVYDKAEAEAATVITTAGGVVEVFGADMVEAIRLAVAQIQAAGYRPTAALVNPADAATLDIFIWQTTQNGMPTFASSLWGVQIIPVATVPAGSAFVGDFTTCAGFYYRGAADLFVSDSDVGLDQISNFKRNILTWLAEMRAKTVVTRPEALVKATVGTAPGAASRKG